MSATPVRWGVIGATSTVARQAVVPALESSPGAEVAAGASASRGQRYQDVLDDDAVEAVYIPLPNGLHAEWTLRAAAAGKHVLCEKPLATTAAEATTMAAACEAAEVVLCEAYMTPYHPRSVLVDEVRRSGRLGALRFASTRFSFVHRQPGDHRWRPEMGGGALADLGVYCLDPLLVASGGTPRSLAAQRVDATSGVDATFAGWLTFDEGFATSFACSFEAPEHQSLELVGTEGALRVVRPFTPGPADTEVEMVTSDGSVELLASAGGGNAYRGMVDHVSAVIRGQEALRRPPSASIAVLKVMDGLRAVATVV
jgi:predicted dehydrogenase